MLGNFALMFGPGISLCMAVLCTTSGVLQAARGEWASLINLFLGIGNILIVAFVWFPILKQISS